MGGAAPTVNVNPVGIIENWRYFRAKLAVNTRRQLVSGPIGTVDYDFQAF
jgi:hypothetical protein